MNVAKALIIRTDPTKTTLFAVFNYTGTHESQNWDIEQLKTDPAKVKVPPYYPDTEIVRRNIAKMYDNVSRLIRLWEVFEGAGKGRFGREYGCFLLG